MLVWGDNLMRWNHKRVLKNYVKVFYSSDMINACLSGSSCIFQNIVTVKYIKVIILITPSHIEQTPLQNQIFLLLQAVACLKFINPPVLDCGLNATKYLRYILLLKDSQSVYLFFQNKLEYNGFRDATLTNDNCGKY